MDDFNLLIEKINEFNKKEIPIIIARTRSRRENIKLLKPFVIQIPNRITIFNDQWQVVAVDGGMDNTLLEGIGLAIASAHTFSIGSKIPDEEEKELQFFNTPSNEQSQIVATTEMKALEYVVAKKKLEQIYDKEHNFLFLLDGAITFPDATVGLTKISSLEKAYNSFVNAANDFYEAVISKPNVHVLAVSKDSRSGKYLKGAIRQSDISNIVDSSELKRLSKFLVDEGWQERIAIQSLMRTMSPATPSYMKPVALISQEYNVVDLPFPSVKKTGVYGTYYYYPQATHALYVEFLGKTLDQLSKLMGLFTFLSRISPIIGYPYPLVYVDKLTRIAKDFSRSMFSQIIVEIRRKAPDIADDITSSLFRETLH